MSDYTRLEDNDDLRGFLIRKGKHDGEGWDCTAFLVITVTRVDGGSFDFTARQVVGWGGDPKDYEVDADEVSGLMKYDGSLHVHADYLNMDPPELAWFYQALACCLVRVCPKRYDLVDDYGYVDELPLGDFSIEDIEDPHSIQVFDR